MDIVTNNLGHTIKNQSKLFILLFIMLLSKHIVAQETIPVLQKQFKGLITDIHISPDKAHFITIEGNPRNIGGCDIKLWDYRSKIMLSSHHLESMNGIGSGKFTLLNNGILIFSANHSIQKINLFNKTTEAIFNVEWPEFIHHYVIEKEQLKYVATKHYSEKSKTVYDITNKASLYKIRDLKSFKKIDLDFELSSLYFSNEKEVILAGTNKGDVFFYDVDLKPVKESVTFFKKEPITFIYESNNNVIGIPAIPMAKGKGYSHDLMQGRFKVYNLKSQSFNLDEELIKQSVPKTESVKNSVFEIRPHNSISSVTAIDNNIVLSYGFNRLDFLDLKSLKLNDISPNDATYKIGKIVSNHETDEFLISYGEISAFGSYDQVAVYKPKFKEITFKFKELPDLLYKDRQIITSNRDIYIANILENKYGEKDSLVIQSMITNKLSSFSFESCKLNTKALNGQWIIYDSNSLVFVGKPNSKLFNQNYYKFKKLRENGQYRLNHNNFFSEFTYLDLSELGEDYYLRDIYDYNPKNKTLFVLLWDKNFKNKLALIDDSGNIKKIIGNYLDIIATVSPNHKYLATMNEKGIIEILDIGQMQVIHKIKISKTTSSREFTFSNDNKSLFFQQEVITSDGLNTYGLFKMDLQVGESSIEKVHDDEFYNNLFIDEDFNRFYISGGSVSKVFNYKTQKNHYKHDASFTQSKPYLNTYLDKIILDEGNNITVFNRGTDDFIQFYFLPDNKYIAIDNEGYFMASPNLNLDIFGYLRNKKGYSFSQFDLIFNRPDKILEFFGIVDDEQLDLFKEAYLKRLAQQDINVDDVTLNIDELPITELDIDNTSFSVDVSNYTVNASFKDLNGKLKSYNIWVNGVPVFGSKGVGIPETSSEFYKASKTIKLSSGNNKVEVSAINTKGLESLRQSVNVYLNSTPEKGKLIFVGIGVSKYKDSTYNLTYSTKDVSDMSDYVKTLGDNYSSIEVVTLLDDKVINKNIIALKQRLEQTTVNDKVVLLYAGHGLLDEDYNYYIGTHNVDFENPQKNGLPYAQLENLLDAIPAREKLVLIDACHSGEVDTDNAIAVEGNIEENHVSLGYRGASAVSSKDKKKQSAFQLMQTIFSDLRLGNGSTVISSASGLEFAYEGEDWKNGVFTYALLEGLKSNKIDVNLDGEILISEIIDYVSKRVNDLTSGRQQPNARAINLDLDWTFKD